MIKIESWDQLVEEGIKRFFEQVPNEQLKFSDELVMRVKISGTTWDGTIDYRGAQFVLDLQRAVNQLYQELYDETIPLRRLSKLIRVRVKVVDGCSLFEVNLNDAITKMVGAMTGGEILIFTGIVATAIVAGYSVKKFTEYRQRIALAAQEADKDQAVVEKLTGTLNKALEVIEKEKIQAPTRNLIGKLDSEDTIELPGREPMPAAAAKKIYPRNPRSDKKSGRFDATYIIKNIDLSESPPVFTLTYDGFEIPAFAELASTDIEKFAKDLEKTLKKKSPLEVGLHVFINYTDRKYLAASIQGTGEPREGTEDIKPVIDMWRKKDR